MLLPYSIVTLSIVTAILPHISRLALDGKRDEVKAQLIRAIRLVGVITVPSAVAFLLFGPLITESIFIGIPAEDSRYIGYVLSALSFGLVAFSINLVLIRGFNAFEDTKTQVISILVINVVSVAISYSFLYFLKTQWITVGLGAAFSVSYLIGLLVTLGLLKKHVGKLAISEFLGQHLRLLIASLLAMVPIFVMTQYISWFALDLSRAARAGELFVVMVVAFFAYILAAKALHIEEVSMIRHLGSSISRRSAKSEENE
jgi:putative peptidoglycan lipid II flippase